MFMDRLNRIAYALLFTAYAAVAQDPLPEQLDPNMAQSVVEDGKRWIDARELGIEGQGWAGDALAAPYDRLPARAEGVVRPPVWSLSRHSAGLNLRFQSDSKTISARWTLRNDNLAMNHMAATGVSGLDLYARDDSGRWRYVGTGRPTEKSNEGELVSAAPEGMQEYWLFLPLYNGVEQLAIGVKENATIEKAAPWDSAKRPIVIYGTSITQGGCASRTGMAYTSILSRRLDWPVINLGFSGNGKMEPEMAELLAELDPVLYFIDSGGNMEPEEIDARCAPLVRTLRAAHPDTPVIMAEFVVLQDMWFEAPRRETYEGKNGAFRRAYGTLLAEGVQHLSYIRGKNLLGDDGLGTVDGVHPTDLGFIRMADAFEPMIRALLPETD
jgi:lysophospholipase L1-like esterase